MHEILAVWISPAYSDKYTLVFQISIIAYSIVGLSRPAHQTLQGIGKVKFTSLTYAIVTIIMLGSLYFLSQNYGLLGAISANLVMTVLLVYNIRLYYQNNKRLVVSNFFFDLGLGISIPLLFFLLSRICNSFEQKAILSLLLFSLLGIITLKDLYFMSQGKKIIQKIFNRTNNETYN
jgi:O-antigen/teichoic acid export membrane protein